MIHTSNDTLQPPELGDVRIESNLRLTDKEYALYERQRRRLESDTVIPNTLHHLQRNLLLLFYGLRDKVFRHR